MVPAHDDHGSGQLLLTPVFSYLVPLMGPGCILALFLKEIPLRTTTTAASSITKSVDSRLAALQGYPIDLHRIHFPYGSLSSRAGQVPGHGETGQGRIDLLCRARIPRVALTCWSTLGARAHPSRLSLHGLGVRPACAAGA
jgi:hypothetical protein